MDHNLFCHEVGVERSRKSWPSARSYILSNSLIYIIQPETRVRTLSPAPALYLLSLTEGQVKSHVLDKMLGQNSNLKIFIMRSGWFLKSGNILTKKAMSNCSVLAILSHWCSCQLKLEGRAFKINI